MIASEREQQMNLCKPSKEYLRSLVDYVLPVIKYGVLDSRVGSNNKLNDLCCNSLQDRVTIGFRDEWLALFGCPNKVIVQAGIRHAASYGWVPPNKSAGRERPPSSTKSDKSG